jgi:hypothetical protein
MKRSTGTVLVVFLALVGLMLYLNQKNPSAGATDVTPTAPVESLFSATDGLPTGIDIKSKTGEEVSVERNNAGVWVLKQPIEAEADQGSAEAAASQVTALHIVSKPDVAPDAAGLTQPSYVLTVKLTGGAVKTVRIGDLTPTSSGYYTSVDESNEVLIVSKTGLDALLTMVTTPPIASTPTPTPAP